MQIVQTPAVRWIGRSTETKPSDAAHGTEFYELDTGVRWLWDDDNNVWVENIEMATALTKALGYGQR
jgi:hypothetical protein